MAFSPLLAPPPHPIPAAAAAIINELYGKDGIRMIHPL
jgi:hypothetical protein